MATVTDFTGRLFQGSDEIDLSGGDYCIATGFIPPSVQLVPLIASGTSANTVSGGVKKGIRATDRSLLLPIAVPGASEREVRTKAGVLANFLQRGTEQNPVVFELRTNSDIEFLPSWGQDGSAFRFEIIHASVPTITQPEYMEADNKTIVVFVDTELLIKPYATGLEQELAKASGGLLEDTIGTIDGSSRGTSVQEATTNKITNPIFGNAIPPLNWVGTGFTISSTNTNTNFVLFGFNSIKVTGVPGGDARLVIGIAAGNINDHYLTAYVKRPDGGTVTSADVSLYYNVKLATNYVDEGDGWYRLTAAVTGIVASTDTGIFVEDARTVYLDGVQLEEMDYPTALSYGDLLGNSWSGTDHDSTSTRGVAFLDAPSVRDVAEGYIRVVWRAGNDSADLTGSDLRLFQEDTTLLEARWIIGSMRWRFNDGTTSVNSAVTSFSTNDVIIFHFVWGPSGIAIYIAGVLEASDATYTPETPGDFLSIGSRSNHSQQIGGTFLDFTVGNVEIDATEVTNDHGNALKAVEDGVRLMPIPYFWTKDGDNILDTGDTSTTDNWGIIGGIAGSAEADTIYQVDPSGVSSDHYWLAESSFDYKDFLRPTSPIWFYNKTGTVDANANGGSAETVPSSLSTISAAIVNPKLVTGKLNIFMRARRASGAATTYEVTPRIQFGGSNIIEGKTKKISFSTTYNTVFLGSVVIDPPFNLLTQDELEMKIGVEILDTSGGAVSLLIDYQMAMNGPFLRMSLSLPTVFDIIINGITAIHLATTLSDTFPTEGEAVEPVPDKWNIVWFFAESFSLIVETFEFDFIKITPRWYLL